MGILLTTAFSLVLWIVLWALGVKAFDGFMLVVFLVLIAATLHSVTPMLPGRRDPDADAPDPAPYN